MIRAARLFVGTLCLSPLAFFSSPAGAEDNPIFYPTIEEVVGSHPSARCDISDDGRWIVGSAATNDIWGFRGLSLHDQLTSATTVIEAEEPFNHIDLSDNGDLITYTRTPAHGFSYAPAHIYQYDRLLGQVRTITDEPKVVLWIYVSDDGNYVLWKEISDPNNLNSKRTAWIWERATNRRVDVTETDARTRPATPFTGSFDPIVMRMDQDYHIWVPLTGAKIYNTPPAGMNLAEVQAVSDDGERVLYETRSEAPPNHTRIVLADRSGTILADTAVEALAEFRIANFNLSDDGSTVLVQGHRQLFRPDAPETTAGAERNWVSGRLSRTDRSNLNSRMYARRASFFWQAQASVAYRATFDG